MKHRSFTVTILYILGFSSVACSQVAVCPDTIRTDQKLASQMAEWEVYKDSSPPKLSSVTFYSGHPDQKASLAPDFEKRDGSTITSEWIFPEEEHRIACEYNNTNLKLIKKLDPRTSRCSAVYDTQITIGGKPLIKSITCK